MEIGFIMAVALFIHNRASPLGNKIDSHLQIGGRLEEYQLCLLTKWLPFIRNIVVSYACESYPKTSYQYIPYILHVTFAHVSLLRMIFKNFSKLF